MSSLLTMKMKTKINLGDRLTRLTLMSLSLVVGFLLLPSKSAKAEGDVYIDMGCHPVPNSVIENLSEPPWFDYKPIFYSRKFTANGQPYWFYAATHTDGAAMFCISQPNFISPRRISLSGISSHFIENIEQNSNLSPIFIVRVRQGQNTGVPFADYRLDLSNPERPVSSFVREGCCIYFRGWAVTQAAEPSLRSSFEEWCQQKASLSAEARKTVEVLLEEADTTDCELAANNVSSRTELNLSGNEITDLRRMAGLTNLTKLYLSYNQITDISPLARLTNLYELNLTGNPIAQPVCPVSPPTVCEFEYFPPQKI